MPSVVSFFEYGIYWIGMIAITIGILVTAFVKWVKK